MGDHSGKSDNHPGDGEQSYLWMVGDHPGDGVTIRWMVGDQPLEIG